MGSVYTPLGTSWQPTPLHLTHKTGSDGCRSLRAHLASFSLPCKAAVKPTSRPTPFLGNPSPNSWQREKGRPPLPSREPLFCPLLCPFGDFHPKGAGGALHELPIRVVGQTLRGPGRAMAGPLGDTSPSPPPKLLAPLAGKEEPSPVHGPILWIWTPPAATPPNTARPLPATLGPCITKASFPACL